MAERNIGFKISIGTESEKKWIADTQIKMAWETEDIQLDRETVLQGVQYIFEHPDRGFYVIAKTETSKPIGILLVLKEWSDWRNGDVWWIHSVYVEKDFRRMGVFSKMFNFVEAKARSEGIRGLRLYVEKENQRAKKVYQALGMSSDRYDMFEKMFGEY